jgi:hypothetical protein
MVSNKHYVISMEGARREAPSQLGVGSVAADPDQYKQVCINKSAARQKAISTRMSTPLPRVYGKRNYLKKLQS